MVNKWDKKYKEKDNFLNDPDSFVVENFNAFNKGTLLDFASGDGRNSIFLAKKGFNVTAADFSVQGLKRLDSFASKEDVTIKTALLNLETKDSLLFLGKFDNILICNYKVDYSLIPIIESMLNPSGILMYSTHNMKHHYENGFNKSFCLEEGELKDKFSISLLEYKTFDTYKDAYIFQK